MGLHLKFSCTLFHCSLSTNSRHNRQRLSFLLASYPTCCADQRGILNWYRKKCDSWTTPSACTTWCTSAPSVPSSSIPTSRTVSPIHSECQPARSRSSRSQRSRRCFTASTTTCKTRRCYRTTTCGTPPTAWMSERSSAGRRPWILTNGRRSRERWKWRRHFTTRHLV